MKITLRFIQAVHVVCTLGVALTLSEPASATDVHREGPCAPSERATPEATADAAGGIPVSTSRQVDVRIFAGVGYLASVGANGIAVSSGVRVAIGGRLALSFDMGYGTMSASPSVEDRWWLVPAIAAVIPAGPRVLFDLGLGAGFGTASAFSPWQNYTKDDTVWAAQLVPVARLHAVASFDVSRRWELFVRADLAVLIVNGTTVGDVSGIPPSNVEASWMNVSLGARFRLL